MIYARALRLLFVAVAGEHWEAGILGEAGIAVREVAEGKDRAACGFEAAGMKTIGAEAGTQGVQRLLLPIRHVDKNSAVCECGDA